MRKNKTVADDRVRATTGRRGRRSAEEELRESEQRYRHLVEDINEIVFAADATGRLTYISPVVTNLGGYTPSEMVGRPFTDFVHPDDVPSAMERFRGSLSGDVEPIELRFVSKSGEVHWVRTFARPVLDGDRVVGLRGVQTNVTERRQAEEELRESEERYRDLVENINEAIFELDAGGRITYITPVAEQAIGYPLSEIVGRPFADFLHPDDLASAVQGFQRALSGHPTPNEYRLLSKTGEVFWVRSFGRPIFEGDRIVGVRGVLTDVTESKQAEHALRDSEERYRTVFELAFEGIVIHEDGVILDANPAFERMYRYKLSELVGMSMLRLTAQESRDLVLQKFRSASGETYEAVALRKDGTTFLAEVLAKRRTYKGRRVRVVAVRDITERKRAEQALRDSEERFRQVAATANEWISEVDAEGRFTYSSPAVKDILGYEPQEIIGKHFFDFYTPEDRKQLLAEAREIGAAKKTYLGAIARNVHKDGHTVIVESSGLPILDSEGNVAGYRNVARDVTERRRVEEALQQSEEHFRSLIENASDMISIYDADGTRRFASPSYERVLGYKQQELIGKSAFDLVHPDDLPAAVDGLAGAVRNPGVTHSAEFRLRHKDGSWRSVESVGRILVDDSGVASIVVNSRDITERKRIEEALRESEERYRDLAENLNDAIFEFDTRGRMTYMSSGMQEVSGYSPSEMIGRPFTRFVYPEDLPAVAERIRERPFGNRQPSEYRLLRKSGEVRWVQSLGRPVFAGDRVVAFRGVLTDITERKQAEDALRQSEERYRTLVEAAPDVIYSLSRDGIIISLNSAFESISGWSRDEWLGKHFAAIIHPDDLPAAAEDFRLTLRGEVPPVGEYRMLAKSGQYLSVETVPRPLTVDGKVVATFGIARDISERKRMEEALQSTREELESAVECQMQRGNAYGLTFRELTVLHLVADGRSDREIAAILGISNQTAHKHVASILSKMGVGSRTEASVRAVREGVLD